MENTSYTVPKEIETPKAEELLPKGPSGGPPGMPRRRSRPGRRKRILKRILYSLIGLAAAGGMSILTYYVFFAPQPVYYLTGRIEVWDGTDDKPALIRNIISGYGYLMPEQSETVMVAGEGAVLMSNVWQGAQVQEGDVLVTLDSSVIDKAVAELHKQIDAAALEITGFETKIGETHTLIGKVYDELREANAEEFALREAAKIYAPFTGRIEETPKLAVGQQIYLNDYLGRIIDDSKMKLTLYFSYGYENDIYIGQRCDVSIPSAMASIEGTVTDIEKVRRVMDGLVTFAVEITVDNPGALTDTMSATVSMRAAGGELILPVGTGTLEYTRMEPIFAQSRGSLKLNNLREYAQVREGDLLLELNYTPNTEIEDGYMGQIRILEETIANYETGIEGKEEQIQGLFEAIDREYQKMDDLIFTSPITGVITSWNDIWPGMSISPNNPVMISIAQMETLTMQGEIYQSDIQKVQVGMDVEVETYVWGEYATIPGKLVSIDKTANQMGGGAYFPVVIAVDNSMGQLMEGFSASFSITLEISENPIVVPMQAVQPFGNHDYVFLRTPDGKVPEEAVELPDGVVPPGFHAIRIKCGINSSRFVEVTEGLKPEWKNWEVFTQKTDSMPSPGPSYDFEPDIEDLDPLDAFDKGYRQGLEDAANASPSPEEEGNDGYYDEWGNWIPLDPWAPGGDIDWPGGDFGKPDDGWDEGEAWDGGDVLPGGGDDTGKEDAGGDVTWDEEVVWDGGKPAWDGDVTIIKPEPALPVPAR